MGQKSTRPVAPEEQERATKRKRPRLKESWDARRTALPRSLLTNSLTSSRGHGNGPNVLFAWFCLTPSTCPNCSCCPKIKNLACSVFGTNRGPVFPCGIPRYTLRPDPASNQSQLN